MHIWDRDHYTSSTIIDGKGGASSSSLQTMLEEPTEYMNARWLPTWHRMDHVTWLLGLFSNATFWRLSEQKTGRPWHSERLQPLVYFNLSCVKTRMNRNSLKYLLVEGPITHDFTLHLGSVTTLHDFGGVLEHLLNTFLLGSHNYMVTALGSCVKCPNFSPSQWALPH